MTPQETSNCQPPCVGVIGSCVLLGATVRVKEGASAWMKQRGFWLKDWPDSIDGMDFIVKADYTHLGGDSAHWWLENDTVKDCGVHPDFCNA